MTGARSRFSDFPPRAALGTGLPPIEGWGIGTRDPKKPRKPGEIVRSAKSRARRALRLAAKAAGMPFKSFIRKMREGKR
jgi:hypothetical protein